MASKTPGRFAKNDSRYWASRIFKPVSGLKEESPHYSMKVAFKGQRMSFSLGTGNKDTAAAKARGIYGDLLSLGVEATLAKHRPKKKPTAADGVATIGAWIAAAGKVFDGRPETIGGYARHLRTIGADILKITKTRKRATRGKIDVAPLDIFTPEAVQSWRLRFVKRAGDNPAKQRAARISANSMMRQARSLFSAKITRFLSALRLPVKVPFAGWSFSQGSRCAIKAKSTRPSCSNWRKPSWPKKTRNLTKP